MMHGVAALRPRFYVRFADGTEQDLSAETVTEAILEAKEAWFDVPDQTVDIYQRGRVDPVAECIDIL